MSSRGDLIKVTHFINPHMFWFRYESSFFLDDPLYDLENKLQTYGRTLNPKQFPKGYAPKRGEVVLVMSAAWNKWIRAEVDDIIEYYHDETKYIVWAMDHGVPFSATSKWIRPLLPELAAAPIKSVYYGGLANIVPAEMQYDFEQSTLSLKMIEKWSTCSVKMVNDLLFDTATVVFYPAMIIGEHHFGSVEIVTHSGKKENISKILLGMQQATESTNFMKDLTKTQTIKIYRWHTNDGIFRTETLKGHNATPKMYSSPPADIKPQDDNKYSEHVKLKVEEWESRNEILAKVPSMSDIDDDLNESVSMIGAVCAEPAQMVANTIPKENDTVPRKSKSLKSNESDAHSAIPTHVKLEDLNDEQFYKQGGLNQKTRSARYADNLPRLPSVTNEADVLRNIDTLTISDSDKSADPKDTLNECSVVSSSSSASIKSGKSKMPPALLQLIKAKKTTVASEPIKKPDVVSSPKPLLIPAGYNLNDLHNCKTESSESVNSSMKKNRVTANGKNTHAGKTNYVKPSYAHKTVESHSSNINYSEKLPSNFNRALEEEECASSNLSSAHHRVLVHGAKIPKPIESIALAHFCDEVHHELQSMRLNQIYRIQSYAWPHLMRGNSLVVINSAGSGKTLSHLPAICSLVKNNSTEIEEDCGVGPIAIIICTSSVEVEKTAKTCIRFLRTCVPKLNIVSAYGVRDMSKIYCHLLNGCDILVTTPLCLYRMLNENINLFDKNRLRQLVIENLNLIINQCQKELGTIITKLCSSSSENNVQLVITSRSWHSSLPSIFKFCNNLILCIGAYIEAAVYARSEIKLKLVEEQYKMDQVVHYLKKMDYTSERTLIICSKLEEVRALSERLKIASILHCACDNASASSEISLAKECNNQQPYQVVICTDVVLFELDVQNAINVIHFSLPRTWSLFSMRFSTSFKTFSNYLTEEGPKQLIRSIILLDENNNEQLPRIIEFLDYHKTKIPKNIKVLSQQIRIQIEEQKTVMQKSFCPFILSTGICKFQNECQHRHVLTKNDCPIETIPRNGTIKLQVINIQTPTHFTVRLLEHKPIDGKKWIEINRSHEYLRFSLSFSKHFADVGNHQIHYPTSIGDFCVVTDGNTFDRCVITEKNVTKRSFLESRVQIKVRLIDTGKTIWIKESELLALPKQFQDFPAQATDLRIAGVVPNDFESEWDSNVLKNVKAWMEDNVKEKIHIEGDVQIALMNCIWVNTLKLIEKLTSLSCQIHVISIKETLLSKNFGTRDDGTLQMLRDLAREAGILNETPHIIMSQRKLCDNKLRGRRRIKHSINDNSSSSSIKVVCSKATSSSSSSAVPFSKHATSSSNETTDELNSSVEHEPVVVSQKKPIIEQWASLKDNTFQRTCIGIFYGPDVFFVQNSKYYRKLQLLYNEIDNYVSKIEKTNSSEHFNIGDTCLAREIDKYNRAKLVEIICDEKAQIQAKVFFVDNGLQHTVPLNEILPITEHLINFLPFQAIKCKLIGIKPKNADKWDPCVSDEIYDNILSPCANLFVRSIHNTSTENPNPLVKCHSYNVILIDCTTEIDINLNNQIVDDGYAEFDAETNHFLDIVYMHDDYISDSRYGTDDGEEENWDDDNYIGKAAKAEDTNNDQNDNLRGANYDLSEMCIEFSEEDLREMLCLPATAKFLPPIDEQDADAKKNPKKAKTCDNNDEKIVESIETSKDEVKNVNDEVTNKLNEPTNKEIPKSANAALKTANELSAKVEDASKMSSENDVIPMPELICSTKRPNVIWQQSESVVYIKIHVPDVKDYKLEVTSSTLQFSAKVNTDHYSTILHFFGSVNNEYVGHEIRGLYVQIRLLKFVIGEIFNWPRLIRTAERCNWLKYNMEALQLEDNEKLSRGLYKQQMLRCADYSSNDEYESDESVGKDDAADPFKDDFK